MHRLAADGEANGVDVTDCVRATSALRIASARVISNTSSCITEKIVKSQNLVKDIGVKTDTALIAVGKFADDTSRCLDGVQDVFGLIVATKCILDVSIFNFQLRELKNII